MSYKQLEESQKLILGFIQKHPNCTTQDLLRGLSLSISIATLKRYLHSLVLSDSIVRMGANKNRTYKLSESYFIRQTIDVEAYFKNEVDERGIKNLFNHLLIKETLQRISLFTTAELDYLQSLQSKYEIRVKQLSKTEYRSELERLAIDLSWKSSQIEGNTYSLLETEYLLLHKQTAAGKTKDEAVMLLNHKTALDFLFDNPDFIQPLTVSRIEDMHRLLVDDLNVSLNIRNRAVGISGTNYRPLDNEFQIKDALVDLCALVNQKENVLEKALLVLALISYIQPFSDGNKRTARIISNGLLLRHGYCPISFRTVDSIEYKKALLIFYEQNCITPFKQLFMQQFEYAVNHYF
ncbi:MAG: hypothetical protein RLZ05_634 [Bacteroidota bacterium]